jgi:hypothetical protein
MNTSPVSVLAGILASLAISFPLRAQPTDDLFAHRVGITTPYRLTALAY